MVKSAEVVKAGSSIPNTQVLSRRGTFRGVRISLEGSGGGGHADLFVYDGTDNTGPLIWSVHIETDAAGEHKSEGEPLRKDQGIIVGTGIYVEGTMTTADDVDVIVFYDEEL